MKTRFHSHFYAIFHEFLWWTIKTTGYWPPLRKAGKSLIYHVSMQ